nr:hypothetical protein [Tanacetum cinerariifolium]
GEGPEHNRQPQRQAHHAATQQGFEVLAVHVGLVGALEAVAVPAVLVAHGGVAIGGAYAQQPVLANDNKSRFGRRDAAGQRKVVEVAPYLQFFKLLHIVPGGMHPHPHR